MKTERLSASKLVDTADEAVSGIRNGDTIMVGGFGDAGTPFGLLDALVRRCVGDLTIISNNCGTGEQGLAALFKHGRVRRVFASFPLQAGNHHFAAAWASGSVEFVLVPQGTLAERVRAAGAGIGGILTPTGVDTLVAEGKEVLEVDGKRFLLELPLRADSALVKADIADESGNLRYRRSGRNFNPLMAMAGRSTIAEVSKVIRKGALDPDDIHTPGVFVDRIWSNR